MSVEENKKVVRRIIDEVFNQKKLDSIDQLVTPDWSFHGLMGRTARGPEGFKKLITEIQAGMPDLRVELLDILGEGDLVFHRWLYAGTVSGTFQGVFIPGKKLTLTIFHLSRFSAGREAEIWEVYDSLDAAQQLGQIPGMAGAAV